MKVIRNSRRLAALIRSAKRRGKTVGFVPTMGYFHEGHLSLMRAARRECGLVVVSIFVNPIQFGPSEDFKTYPRDLKRDLKMAREAGADMVFSPSVRTMYPQGFSTYVETGKSGEVLCGRFRPGHFRGVATVVAKLFHQVQPDRAYFGQKDAQQAFIIRKMVKDLDMPITVRVLPVVREKDGLAMSSRNVYLSPQERKDAAVLFSSLQHARGMVKSGVKDAEKLNREIRRIIGRKKSVTVQYAEVVDPGTLEPLKKIGKEALIAVAAKVGTTRLIDNMRVRC